MSADIQEEYETSGGFVGCAFLQQVKRFLGTRGKARHNQVQVPVLIQIKETGTEADSVQLVQTRLGGHVVKSMSPFALVAEEPLLPNARDEQVGKAVVIEVADGAAQTEPRLRQSGLVCDIGEDIVAVIAQE